MKLSAFDVVTDSIDGDGTQMVVVEVMTNVLVMNLQMMQVVLVVPVKPAISLVPVLHILAVVEVVLTLVTEEHNYIHKVIMVVVETDVLKMVVEAVEPVK